MISLRTHNIIDYFLGGWLIVSPWLFGFSDLTRASEFFIWAGVTLLLYSCFTQYEFSAVKVIPLGWHMTFDTLLGLAILLAPALLDYRDLLTHRQYEAHIALGVLMMGFVALTLPVTARASRRTFEWRRDRAHHPAV